MISEPARGVKLIAPTSVNYQVSQLIGYGHMTQHDTERKQDYGNNLSKQEVLIYSDVMIH